jgi:hypothetical protein
MTLADINDAMIDSFSDRGFAWIWLLSVWQTGAAGRTISRSQPHWRREFEAVLPDLTEDDICGSGFAITAYTVSDLVGGPIALARFREKLVKRGIRLMLDFVPNHTAPDHPWVRTHPEYYVVVVTWRCWSSRKCFSALGASRHSRLAAGDRDGTAEVSAFHFRGRGVLGPGVDFATAGLRLLL